jgi:hypothetical protein
VAVLEQAPFITVWARNAGDRTMNEQWRDSTDTWSGWQPRGANIALP